jgi:hypothetical protein
VLTVQLGKQDAWGSPLNKLMLLGAETHGRQGVEYKEYVDIKISYAGSRTGCIAIQKGRLFLSEPFVLIKNDTTCFEGRFSKR